MFKPVAVIPVIPVPSPTNEPVNEPDSLVVAEETLITWFTPTVDEFNTASLPETMTFFQLDSVYFIICYTYYEPKKKSPEDE